jgi:hypothetical protein
MFFREGLPPDPIEVNRHQQAEAFDVFVLNSGLGSRLSTAEGRVTFVEQLGPQDFLDLLVEMDGVLTDQPATTALLSDHFQVTRDQAEPMKVDVMPPPEDKIRLLSSILKTAQVSPVLDYKPLTLATGVLATHPFLTANGRVARALYYLLSNDYTPGDPGLHAVLQEDGTHILPLEMALAAQLLYPELRRRNDTHVETNTPTRELQPRVYPAIEDRSRNIAVDYAPYHRAANESTEAALFGVMVADRYLPEMIPTMLMRDYPPTPAVIDSYGTNGARKVFAIDRFLLQATDEDVAHVYEIYKKISRQYVQTLARTVAYLEHQNLRSMVYINEGNGRIIETLPNLLLYLARGAITPNLAANDALYTNMNQRPRE